MDEEATETAKKSEDLVEVFVNYSDIKSETDDLQETAETNIQLHDNLDKNPDSPENSENDSSIEDTELEEIRIEFIREECSLETEENEDVVTNISVGEIKLEDEELQYEQAFNPEENSFRNKEGQRIFKCQLCNYTTKYRSHYTRHGLKHILIKNQCRICHFVPKTRGEFLQHINKIHKNGNLFKCPECEYTSKVFANVGFHKTSMHGPNKSAKKYLNKTFICSVCQFTAPKMRDLEEHQLEHVSDNEVKCGLCDESFVSHNVRKLHVLRNHRSEEGKWVCYVQDCNFVSIKLDTLKKHLLGHEDEGKFECPECPFRGKRRSDLKQHILVRHTPESEIPMHKCPDCEYSSKRTSHLYNHIRSFHKKEPCYPCTVTDCEFSSTTIRQLQKHTKEHEEGAEIEPKPKRPKRNPIREVVINNCNDSDTETDYINVEGEECLACKHCSFKSTEVDYMRMHIAMQHLRSGQERKCPACTFHTPRRTDYLLHLKLHKYNVNLLKPILCEICGSSWLRKGDLTKHMFTHWETNATDYSYIPKPKEKRKRISRKGQPKSSSGNEKQITVLPDVVNNEADSQSENESGTNQVENEPIDTSPIKSDYRPTFCCPYCDYKSKIRVLVFKHFEQHGVDVQAKFSSLVIELLEDD